MASAHSVTTAMHTPNSVPAGCPLTLWVCLARVLKPACCLLLGAVAFLSPLPAGVCFKWLKSYSPRKQCVYPLLCNQPNVGTAEIASMPDLPCCSCFCFLSTDSPNTQVRLPLEMIPCLLVPVLSFSSSLLYSPSHLLPQSHGL